MDKYFLEIPHDEKDCAKALQLLHIRGFFEKLAWGCESGQHTGMIIAEADNEQQLLNILPPLLRSHARVFKLNQFSLEQMIAMGHHHPLSPEEKAAAKE